MRSFLFCAPFIGLWLYDRICAFRGISNPVTWRYYVGFVATFILALVVKDHVQGDLGAILYWSLSCIGPIASYIWNNSADTSGNAL